MATSNITDQALELEIELERQRQEQAAAAAAAADPPPLFDQEADELAEEVNWSAPREGLRIQLLDETTPDGEPVVHLVSLEGTYEMSLAEFRQKLASLQGNRHALFDELDGVVTPLPAVPEEPPKGPLFPKLEAGPDPTPAWANELNGKFDTVGEQLRSDIDEVKGLVHSVVRDVDGLKTSLVDTNEHVQRVDDTVKRMIDEGVETLIAEAASKEDIIVNAVVAGVGRAMIPVNQRFDQVETAVREVGERVEVIERGGPRLTWVILGTIIGFLVGVWIIGPIFYHASSSTTMIGKTLVKTVSNGKGASNFGYGLGFAFVGFGLGVLASMGRSKKTSRSSEAQVGPDRVSPWRNPRQYLTTKPVEPAATPVVVAPTDAELLAAVPPGTVVEETQVLPATATS